MLGAPRIASWPLAGAPVSGERHLSPAETARRLGVTVKALRVYERHGLVKPVRTAASWRTYGPAEIARLHQVLALKRLGLSLAKIGVLLNKRGAGLAEVLALQEQALSGESTRVERALALIRAARAKLASGAELSIDDLTTLTKETTMSGKATAEEMKAIFDPITAKYFTPEETKALTNRKLAFDGAQAWEAVIEDAKRAMAEGDPASPEALAVARRWRGLVNQFTGGDPAIAAKVKAVWSDAMADPKTAPRLPLNPEIFAFMAKAQQKLKESEG
jgi:DNA-binding transcriptional MerR regulator